MPGGQLSAAYDTVESLLSAVMPLFWGGIFSWLLRQPTDPAEEERKQKEAARIAAMPLHERMVYLRRQLDGEKANPHARATPAQLASRGLWTAKRPRASVGVTKFFAEFVDVQKFPTPSF